jgi:Tfp pilus assembly ATPase PilU
MSRAKELAEPLGLIAVNYPKRGLWLFVRDTGSGYVSVAEATDIQLDHLPTHILEERIIKGLTENCWLSE